MALQPSYNGDSSNFAQQGSIDWVQLASRTIGFSIDVLSRLSAANVDPYTLQVGQVVGGQFELSSTGRKNVSAALNSLVSYSSFGDVLWFGFGNRHIVRELPRTNEGFNCLSLFAALSEHYSEDFSPEILHELVKKMNVPSEYTPSVLQWQALIRTCSGVFSKTTFGTLLEELLRHDTDQRLPYLHMNSASTVPNHLVNTVSPAFIATALLEVGKVCKGMVEAIRIVGGRDIGWLASICIWLFGLNIRILDHRDSELYSNCGTSDVQITFIYDLMRYGNVDGIRSQQLHIERTYILQDSRDIFHMGTVQYGGRIPWNRLFQTTFGRNYRKLMVDHTHTFAKAIGSASRLLYGIVHGDKNIREKLIKDWRRYAPGSCGPAFISGLLERFPELEALRCIAEETASTISFLDAIVCYDEQMRALKSQCSCQSCKKGLNSVTVPCYTLIVETIIVLGLMLSEVDVEDNLFPKRGGIENLYSLQRDIHRSIDLSGKDEGTTGLGTFAYLCLDINDRYRLEYDRLRRCMVLFNGYHDNMHGSDVNAISSTGICAYSNILTKFPDGTDSFSRIHVVPGVIEHHGKPYHLVRSTEYGAVGNFDVREIIQYDSVELYVTEKVNELRVDYRASNANSNLSRLFISPSVLHKALFISRGWVECNNSGCEFITSFSDGMDNPIELDVSGQKIWIIKGNAMTRCITVYVGFHARSNYMLRTTECIQCCLRSMLDILRKLPDAETTGRFAEGWIASPG